MSQRQWRSVQAITSLKEAPQMLKRGISLYQDLRELILKSTPETEPGKQNSRTSLSCYLDLYQIQKSKLKKIRTGKIKKMKKMMSKT